MDKTVPTLELRDIHLPADPSIWPLAPGWWLLIILGLVVLYFFIKMVVKAQKTKRLNRLMQDELILVKKAYEKHHDKHQLAVDVSTLLNRFVIHVLNDAHASSLSGDAWINYLNNRVEAQVFDEFQQELTQAQYQKHADFDVPRLMATVKNYFPKAIKNIKKYEKLKRRVKRA